MGSSSGGGGGSDSRGKIGPVGVAHPYIPHADVNHAQIGAWMQGGPQMSPHGTQNPAPYTDPESYIHQAQAQRQGQSQIFQDLLRQLGMPQGGRVGQASNQPQLPQGGAQPNYALPGAWPSWAPPPLPVQAAPLSPAGIWQPTEINA